MSKPSRMEILDLLSNGKITAVEAADLLSNVEKTEAAAPPPPPPAEKTPAKCRKISFKKSHHGTGPNRIPI